MIVMYLPNQGVIAERLLQTCQPLLETRKVTFVRTCNELKRFLIAHGDDSHIFVFLTTDNCELAELESVRHDLEDRRTLMILPNTDSATVTSGISFYPNYISYIDSDFYDVIAVLKKMVTK